MGYKNCFTAFYTGNNTGLKKMSVMKENKTTQEAGFTLPELMIVIVIAAILLALGMPSLQDSIKKGRSASNAKVLRLALQNTRQAAVNKGRVATMCASSDASTCSGSWQDGWLSFIGDGSSPSGDFDELSTRGSYNTNLETLTVTGDSAGTVRFDTDGSLAGAAVVSFVFCADDGEDRYAREVVVAPSGIVTTSRDTDGDGIHNAYTGGGNLSCT